MIYLKKKSWKFDNLKIPQNITPDLPYAYLELISIPKTRSCSTKQKVTSEFLPARSASPLSPPLSANLGSRTEPNRTVQRASKETLQ